LQGFLQTLQRQHLVSDGVHEDVPLVLPQHDTGAIDVQCARCDLAQASQHLCDAELSCGSA